MGSSFDRIRFASRLATRRLGGTIITRAVVGSTNDEAWAACAANAPDGTVVVADAQTRGRGRGGRSWHTAPGQGLALSVLLRQGCEWPALGLLPLVAGLAVAQALERLGGAPALKWPNDVLLGDRKVAGVLCETRRGAAVVGAGITLGQAADEFPEEIAATATSLALAGVNSPREDVAAAFVGALETRWDALRRDGPAALIEAWRARAAFWGREVTVRAGGGELRGVARGLDADGALRLALADGTETVVRAGDLEPGAAEARA